MKRIGQVSPGGVKEEGERDIHPRDGLHRWKEKYIREKWFNSKDLKWDPAAGVKPCQLKQNSRKKMTPIAAPR